MVTVILNSWFLFEKFPEIMKDFTGEFIRKRCCGWVMVEVVEASEERAYAVFKTT